MSIFMICLGLVVIFVSIMSQISRFGIIFCVLVASVLIGGGAASIGFDNGAEMALLMMSQELICEPNDMRWL